MESETELQARWVELSRGTRISLGKPLKRRLDVMCWITLRFEIQLQSMGFALKRRELQDQSTIIGDN